MGQLPTGEARYRLAERLYHAVQAAAILYLLITGLAMLLTASPGPAEGTWLGQSHLIVGLVGPAAMLTIALAAMPHHLRNLYWARSLEPGDLTWWRYMLTLQPGKAHHVPMGRFNPGQKAELLAVPVSLALLLGSGLVLWWRPQWLWARFIHVAVAANFLALVAVHLYMTIINPRTRPSLQVMWLGRPADQWQRQHYPRADEPPEPMQPHSTLWVATVAVGLLVAATILAIVIYATYPRLLSPGPMVHPSLVRHCHACHDAFDPAGNRACQDCHAERLAAATGPAGFSAHSGNRELDCMECHGEHTGRPLRAGVKLGDRQACQLCHHQPELIRVNFNADTPAAHAEHLAAGVTCVSCHSTHQTGANHRSEVHATLQLCTSCHHERHVPREVKIAWRDFWPARDPGSQVPARRVDSNIDGNCRQCHHLEGPALLGIYTPLAVYAEPDPMARTVTCQQCHVYDPISVRWTPPIETCATCHPATRQSQGQTVYTYRGRGQLRQIYARRLVESLQGRFDPDQPIGPALPTGREAMADLFNVTVHNPKLGDQLAEAMRKLAATARPEEP